MTQETPLLPPTPVVLLVNCINKMLRAIAQWDQDDDR